MAKAKPGPSTTDPNPPMPDELGDLDILLREAWECVWGQVSPPQLAHLAVATRDVCQQARRGSISIFVKKGCVCFLRAVTQDGLRLEHRLVQQADFERAPHLVANSDPDRARRAKAKVRKFASTQFSLYQLLTLAGKIKELRQGPCLAEIFIQIEGGHPRVLYVDPGQPVDDHAIESITFDRLSLKSLRQLLAEFKAIGP